MTESVFEILPRNARSAAEIELLSNLSFLIDEFVNFGTHIFKHDLESAKGGDENLPIQMMFRHIMEVGDSVSLLVKSSSIDPCKLLLRGMLESCLGLEYILEQDTHNRAMGYMAWHSHRKLKIYKKLNATEQASKDFVQRLNADKILSGSFSIPAVSDLEDQIKNINSLLTSPAYKNAEAEYMKIAAKENNPPWFRLFGGPQKIEQLANRLNRQAFYEILYRRWSGSTHGTDVIDGKIFPPSEEGKGNVSIVQIRYAKDAQEIVQYALSFLLIAYTVMVNKRLSDLKPDLTKWYMQVQKPYLEIMTTKNMVVVK